GVELQPVDGGLAVGAVAAGDGEPVVGDVPLVGARDLQDRAVPGAENAQGLVLLQDDAAVGPRPVHAGGGGVPDPVVRRTGVVDGVGQVVQPVPVVHEAALAVAGQTGLGRDGAGLERDHVVGQF